MRMRLLSSLVLIASMLAISADHSAAEQLDTPFAEVVDVELVLVDIVAETRSGDPVLDLAREDFRLFEDGKPVEISHFTPAAGALEAGGARSGSPAAGVGQPRQVVIFIDNLHLHANSRRQVIGKLGKSLNRHLEAQDEVMVVAYGGVAEVVLPMTRDRSALKKVLRDQSESGAVSLMADGDENRILQIIQQVRAQTSSGGSDRACRDVGHVAHTHAQQVHGRILGAVSGLERLVKSLGGYPGPKALVHVSDGVPLIAGAEAYLYAAELCDGSGVTKGIPNAMDTITNSGLRYNYWDPSKTWANLQEFNTADEWTELAGHANTYQVSIYTFQAERPSNRAASVDGAPTSLEVERNGERNKQDTLYMMADETGGSALLDGGDIEPVFIQMNADSRHRYQLAYVPPEPADGKPHKIKVEVARPGVELRYRKSYRNKTRDERVGDHVLSVLIHGQQENPLAVTVDVADDGQQGADPASVEVRVRVPIEGLVLLPDDETRRGLFTVYVAVRSGGGRMTPVGQKTLPVRLSGSEEARKEYLYSVAVPVWGEGGDVAVAVRDQIGGETSYLRKSVKVRSTS